MLSWNIANIDQFLDYILHIHYRVYLRKAAGFHQARIVLP